MLWKIEIMKYDSSLFLVVVAVLSNTLFVDVGATEAAVNESPIVAPTAVLTNGNAPIAAATAALTNVNETAAVTNGATDESAMDASSENVTDTAVNESVAETIATTVAPTEAKTLGPVPVIKSTCYNNTNEIFEISLDDRLLYKTKKFILCPNTVYNIGIYGFNATFAGIIDGQYPLSPRMNTIIQCGESGESSNNCTLFGGDWGLITVPVLNGLDFDTSDILIQGITFESQNTYSLFIGLPGNNFVMDDCIIKNQFNQGPIVFNNRGPFVGRRNLDRYDKYEDPMAKTYHYMKDLENGFFDDEMDEHRELKEIGPLHVTIQNSLIANNMQAETGQNLEFGLVTLRTDTHNLTMKNNLIIDNNYGDEMISSIGYALLNVGSEVHLIDNCFVDNQFFGTGMVVMNPGSSFTHSGNYATCSASKELTCPFIVSFDTEEAENLNEYNCHNNSDDATCGDYPVIGDGSCSVGRDDTPDISDTSGKEEDSSGVNLHISNFSRYVLLPTILLVINMNV